MYTGSRLQPQQQQQPQTNYNTNPTQMNQNQNNYLQSQSIPMSNAYAINRQAYYANNGLLGAAPDSSTQQGILQTPQNPTHHLNYHHHNQNSLITLTNGPQQNVLRSNNANRVNNYAYSSSPAQQQQNQALSLNNTGMSLLGTPNLPSSKSLPAGYANSANRNGVPSNKSINNKIRPRFSLNNKLNNASVSSTNNSNASTLNNSSDTSSAAYLQKLKTCIDANRRNINQRLNLNNNNTNSNGNGGNKAMNINSSKLDSNSHLQTQSQGNNNANSSNNASNQYQYHQNKQLIVIKPADDIDDLDSGSITNGAKQNANEKSNFIVFK